ncbi:hypothetical protein ACA910_000115 [Epithemia clementina (nom. ined.)]
MSGKIRARVYETDEETSDELAYGDGKNSPQFVKLEEMAKWIGIAGTVAATVAFVVSCVICLAVNGDDIDSLVDYLITAMSVLAVAVPVLLPLAVTLALAFLSNKVMSEQGGKGGEGDVEAPELTTSDTTNQPEGRAWPTSPTHSQALRTFLGSPSDKDDLDNDEERDGVPMATSSLTFDGVSDPLQDSSCITLSIFETASSPASSIPSIPSCPYKRTAKYKGR